MVVVQIIHLKLLKLYIRKNKEYGYENEEINEKIAKLAGTPNGVGGIIEFDPEKQPGNFAAYLGIGSFDQDTAPSQRIIAYFS